MYTTSDLSILMHDIISLPDTKPCDKKSIDMAITEKKLLSQVEMSRIIILYSWNNCLNKLQKDH